MATKYKFDAFDAAPVPHGKKKNHRRQTSNTSEGGEDNDPTDGNGSLTYSAASSINSAAGESTDSSLAGIMRVLDVQDSKELAAVLEKERIKKHHLHHHSRGEDRSVAAESQHSLAYSTDAESHMRSLATEQSGLAGTGLLGTIAGQSSDQYDYDGGNYKGGGVAPHPPPHPSEMNGKPQNQPQQQNNDDGMSDDFLFTPAEHTDSLKRRKDKKRRERKQADSQTPRVKNSKKPTSSPPVASPGRSSSPNEAAYHHPQQSSRSSPSSHSSPPPPIVSSRSGDGSGNIAARPPMGRGGENMEMAEEEDVWYAKWWMFCFPDTVKTMTPKR